MLKIDIHTHILPPEIPAFKQKFGYGNFMRLDRTNSCAAKLIWDDGRFLRNVEENLWDPKARLKDFVQVLSTMPAMFNYQIKSEDCLEVCKFLNDHIAQTVQNEPKRFIGLGTLPMQSPKLAIQELERCKKIGLAGVQIGTHVNEWNFEAPEIVEVLQCASDLSAAVFVHPWDMIGAEQIPKYWLPWLVGMPAEVSRAICSMIFGGVFEKLPKLRIAFAHGGGAFPHTLGRIEQGFKARPDLCAVDNPHPPSKYVGKFYVDSIVLDPRAFRYLLEIFGENKIALGSDYPFPLGEIEPGKLIESIPDLSPATRQRLLSGTALEWLGRTHV